jgi:hypothetical protein
MASAKDVEARQLVLSTIEQRKQTWVFDFVVKTLFLKLI